MLVYVENGIDCYYCAWVGLNYPLGMTQTDSVFTLQRDHLFQLIEDYVFPA